MDGSNLESELKVSLKPVIVVIVALAIAITIANDTGIAPPFLPNWMRIVQGLYLLSILAWVLNRWYGRASRWLAVLSLIVLVHLGVRWTGVTEVLNLVVIPMALAFPLLGFFVSLGLAAAETLLLIALPARVAAGADQTMVGLVLLLIWSLMGVLSAVYLPRRKMNAWLSEHLSHTRHALEEAQGQKVQLKQALAALAHANRQQSLTNERLAALRTVAEEAQKTKTAFVAKVSHEFRTPLNMILGLVNLIVETPEVYDRPLPPDVLEDLQIVYRNCQHLSGMIDDVLALSQAEAGRVTLHRERVNVTELITSAVGVVQPLLAKKALWLETDLDGDLPEVYCDRTRIRQVILNLVSNAARFTEEGGLRVRAAQQNAHVVVSVMDTGPGIAPEDAERIFEPFCQGIGRLWRDKRGSGLGLSISKQFVELHGGQIRFQSEPGVGTTFTFDLPISPPIQPDSTPSRWITENWEWFERTSRYRLPDTHYRPRFVICDETGALYPAAVDHSDAVEWVGVRDLEQSAQELADCPANALLVNTGSVDDLWSVVDEARQTFRETPIIGCSLDTPLSKVYQAHARDYLIKPVTHDDLIGALDGVDRPVQRILIVDDDPDVVQLFTRMLHIHDPQLEIQAASSGQQGLELMRSQAPDLVFLDVVMPDMNGWRLLEIKNRDPALREIPAVFVSAMDPSEQPLESKVLMFSMGEGLTVHKLLDCSQWLSAAMLRAG
jgi:signal transduction histidine kinase/CheY-like chemotaxis protein